MGFAQQFHQPSDPTALQASMMQLRNIMKGDPTAVIQNLMQTNPQFAQFYEQNKGKTPQEAFSAYGYDFDEIVKIVNS